MTIIEIGIMKTTEGIDYKFNSEMYFRNKSSYLKKDSKVIHVQDQGFIVPWQLYKKESKEVKMESMRYD